MTTNTACLGTMATPYGKAMAALCTVLMGVFCWHRHAYPMFSGLQNIAGNLEIFKYLFFRKPSLLRTILPL